MNELQTYLYGKKITIPNTIFKTYKKIKKHEVLLINRCITIQKDMMKR